MTDMGTGSDPLQTSRRGFLLGGGLALSVMLIGGAVRAGIATAEQGSKLSAYVEIMEDGRVSIVTPGAEMGQGVASTLPKIVAEEMDADWSRVVVRLSGADKAFANPNGR